MRIFVNQMKKLIKVLIILFFIGIALSAFFFNPGYTSQPYLKRKILLDTLVEIKAYGRNKGKVEKAVDKAFQEMRRIEKLLNNYDPKSEISRLNQKAGKAMPVSAETFEVVALSKSYGRQTRDAFDITVGPLVRLWDFGESKYIPTQQELEKILPLVNWKNIELNREKRTIRLARKGMSLDLGGVTKGYAADKAIQILKQEGIRSALVTTGSTTRVLGEKPDGKPWQIGIQHPRKEKEIIGTLSLKNQSVSTSGDYQQYFIKKGQRYHHILSPQTGRPVDQVMSVTVVTNKSCAEADILSTAIFVMGYPEGMRFIEGAKNLEGIIVDAQGKVHISSGLRSLFNP